MVLFNLAPEVVDIPLTKDVASHSEEKDVKEEEEEEEEEEIEVGSEDETDTTLPTLNDKKKTLIRR